MVTVIPMPNEIWKPAPGYEDLYEVSNLGRVKRCERSDSYIRCGKFTGQKSHVHYKALMLSTFLHKTSKHSKEYYHVFLQKDGKARLNTVHRLVAKAFVPNPENKPFVIHKDGDISNNTPENLMWVTRSELYNLTHLDN